MLEVGFIKVGDIGATFSGCLNRRKSRDRLGRFQTVCADLGSEVWPVANTKVINVEPVNHNTAASCAPTGMAKHTPFGKLLRISGRLRRMLVGDPETEEAKM